MPFVGVRMDYGTGDTTSHRLLDKLEDCLKETGNQSDLPPNLSTANGNFRDECLNHNWFLDLADSRVMIEDWRTDYDRDRPNSSWGYLNPLEFKRDMNRNLSLAVVRFW